MIESWIGTRLIRLIFVTLDSTCFFIPRTWPQTRLFSDTGTRDLTQTRELMTLRLGLENYALSSRAQHQRRITGVSYTGRAALFFKLPVPKYNPEVK